MVFHEPGPFCCLFQQNCLLSRDRIVSLLPAAAMITEVDWLTVIGTAALAAVASLATSLAGIPEEHIDEA